MFYTVELRTTVGVSYGDILSKSAKQSIYISLLESSDQSNPSLYWSSGQISELDMLPVCILSNG